jgi:hypothetical protein
VVEEILDSQRPGCPIEYFNIPVPNDHPFLQGKESLEMPFPRTRYDSSTGYSPNNPTNKISLSSPLFFEVHVSSQENERSCIYVKVSILLQVLQFSI